MESKVYHFAPNKDFADSTAININAAPIVPPISRKNQLYTLHNTQVIYILFFLIALKVISQSKQYSLQDLNFRSLGKVIDNILNEPDTLEVLTVVTPYLEEESQTNMYSFIGIIETYNMVKGLMDGSYQRRRILNAPLVLDSNKKIGMLKSIKPYIPESKQPIVESIISIGNISDRVSQSIISNQSANNLENKDNIEIISELIRIFIPVIPIEYKDKAYKLIQIINIAKTMNFVNENLENVQPIQYGSDVHENQANTSNDNQKTNIRQDTEDSSETSLNNNQKDTLELLMKMAQLFAQSNSK